MLSVTDVVAELDGSGFIDSELIEISRELTEFTISRQRLQKRLAKSFGEEELNHILLTIEDVSFQEHFKAKIFSSLSPREKECYLMHTVDRKSFNNIAKELGVSKGRVQEAIERSRKKIEKLKLEHIKQKSRDL